MKYYVLLASLVIAIQQISGALNSVWHFECDSGFCQKKAITAQSNESEVLSLTACSFLCAQDTILWPKPTSPPTIGKQLLKINPNSIDVIGVVSETKSASLLTAAIRIFKEKISKLAPRRVKITDGGRSVEVHLRILDTETASLALDADESYELKVEELSDGRIKASISAPNYFGARHALETLNQLILFDNLRNEIIMPSSATIKDKPAYPFRGVGLDTARNYISIEGIKRTLDGMGASKLNSFHWHITDSHSFPFVATSLPELNKLGAYTPEKIYTPEEVRDIVKYGLERGVRIIPEFDAPAHVGEGWQNTDFVLCFNKKPWLDYCVEPPCGQFDPTKEKLYDALELIYGDMADQFQPEIFHMGGDEVHFTCWNETQSVLDWMKARDWGREEEDFILLWDHFQTTAYERLQKKLAKKVPVILWTSALTKQEYLKHLPTEDYIIQIWANESHPQIANLMTANYRVILSNFDALYLDCGFPGWVSGGHNWCSPYNGWQTIYENSPAKVVGRDKTLVLGAEAALWTEQADSAALDSRIWPRAAAMAETLWSEPTGTWRDAEQRFLIHRERLITLGIQSDALEPEWCLQNEENCPLDGVNNENDNDDDAGAVTNLLNLFFVFPLIYIHFI